jgi:hypothetical protein
MVGRAGRIGAENGGVEGTVFVVQPLQPLSPIEDGLTRESRVNVEYWSFDRQLTGSRRGSI